MTGNTTSGEKLRSLFLAALMVFSVFAGSIAFAGTAAAATSVGNASVVPDDVESGSTVTHTFEYTVNEVQSDGNTDTFNVTLPAGSFADTPDSSNVSVTAEDGTTIPVDGTSGANSGQTLLIDISPSSGDTTDATPNLTINFDETVNHADVSGTFPITYSFQDSGGSDVSGTAGVTLGSSFEVTNLDAPRVAANGVEFTVTARINNTGSATQTQDIDFNISNNATGNVDDNNLATQSLTLAPGENQTITFGPFNTSNLDQASDTSVQQYVHGVFPERGVGQSAELTVGTDTEGKVAVVVRGDFDPNIGDVTTVALFERNDFLNDPDPTPIGTAETDEQAGTPDDEVTFEDLAVGGTDQNPTQYVAVGAYNDSDFFSSTTTLELYEPTQTSTQDTVFIERNVTADDIRITASDSTALANGDDQASFTVNVTTDDFPGRTDVPLGNITVTATPDGTQDPSFEFVNADGTTTGTPSVKETNADGEVTFYATDEQVESVDITFEEQDGGNEVTATADFIPLSGNGTVIGHVFDVSTPQDYGIENATVYAVNKDRSLRNSIGVPTPNDDDNTTFYRVINDSTGEVVDYDDYRVDNNGANAAYTWAVIREHNVTDTGVGNGFAVRTKQANAPPVFVTPLTPGNYTVEVSTNQANASDDRFVNENLPTDEFDQIVPAIGNITVSEDLTADNARNLANLTGSKLVDSTDINGKYVLDYLYGNGQEGVEYMLVANADGYERDYVDTLVTADGALFEDGEDENFDLRPREVDPDEVNITNIALLPNASVVAPSENPSDYDNYRVSNATDEFNQVIPRDGKAVDVVQVETLDPNDNPINDSVTLSVPDDINTPNATTANSSNFNGTWVAANPNTVLDSDPVNNTITVKTGSDGQTIVWLVSDQSSEDLIIDGQEGISAVSQTNSNATDFTDKVFLGITEFRQASISGILTDNTDKRVDNTVVYASSFRYDISTSFFGNPIRAANTIVFITPSDATNSTTGLPATTPDASDVDDPTDTFDIVQYRWDGINSEIATPTNPSNSFLGADYNVTRDELGDYAFPSISTVATGPGFPLINNVGDTEYKLVEDNGENDSEYTFRPVPAVGSTAGPDTTAYNVRGVGLQTSPINYRDELANASATVKPTFTGTANLAFGFNVSRGIDVSNLNAPASAQVGSNITVTADVSNLGQFDQNVSVDFQLAGSVIQTQTVALNAGDTQTVTFNIDTTGVAAGTYTHGVFAAGDSETAQITLTGQADFQVGTINSPTSISQGDTLNVSANVTNVGAAQGTKPVSLTINGTNISTGTGAVDITFLIDTSGSMSNEISAVQNGLTDFTNTLQSQGIDVRYSIVTFAQTTPRYTVLQNYSGDVSQTQQTLNSITTGGASEYSFDAMNGSINDLNERSGANEVFITFTDEDSEFGSNPANATAMANVLDANGVQLFAVTLPESQIGADLSVGTAANRSANGQFFNIAEGNFSAKFENEIAGAVANASAGQQVTLAGGQSDLVQFSIAGSTTSNLASGNYTIEVSTPDDTGTASLQVGAGCSNLSSFVAQYDANGDCDIDIGELGQASSDYAQGLISIQELGQVSSAYVQT